MDRKKAIGLASSVSLATVGAVVAVGANFGLFGLSAAASAPPLPVSVTEPAAARIETATLPSEQELIEETRVIEVPVHVPAPASGPGSAPAPAPDEGSDDASTEFTPTSEDGDDDRADDTPGTGGVATPATGPTTASTPAVGSTAPDEDENEYEYDDRDEGRAEPCEVHDDGKVECHDEDD